MVLTVAYQGVPGAYSEVAAANAAAEVDQLLPCSTFEEAFEVSPEISQKILDA